MALRKLSQEEVAGLNIDTAPITNEPVEKTTGDFLGKAAGALDSVFGGGTIGEAIGTFAARRGLTGLSKEERKFVEGGPSAAQIGGDVLRIGSLFTPVGKVAGVTGKLASPLIGKTAGRIAGGAIAGGSAGLAFDIGESVRKGEEFTPVGTAIGAGLPVAGSVGRVAVKTFGTLARELTGVSTGAGGKSISEFFQAVKQGGPRAEAAIKSMRGKLSEDVLVSDAKLALDKVVQTRSKNYTENFKKVINNDQQLDISPINNKVSQMLSDFRIKKAPEGLDFSQSPLKFNTKAQAEIETIVDEMALFGTQKGDRTPLGVDTLKRAFDDIFSESSQARAFTAAIRKETRKVLDDVPGYSAVEKDYETRTRFIKELSRSLSLNDKASTDATLRKLLASLRQQKGFKDELVQQLDEEAGSFISAQIAGQQLNEVLPQGILRSFGVAGAGAAAITGVGIFPLLQALAFTSPRIVGEVLTILGLSARQADRASKMIVRSVKSPGDAILNRVLPNKNPTR